MPDTREYEYADITVSILGAEVTGLRGLKYKKHQEKSPVYGAGNRPKAIQRGNINYEGTLMLLKDDFDRLNLAARAAGYDDLVSLPGKIVTITCVYATKENPAQIKVDTLFGVEFTEFEEGMNQGDQFKEHSLPFVYLRQKQA